MSGHSKWSTIKHGKAVADARRSQLFTKLAKEIIVAVRQGGGDLDMNFRLRMAVEKAKDSNMPSGNIERAIKKGSGDASGQEQMFEVFYEGYGPGGTAVLLQALTDNKNRTVSDVRSTFTRIGGSLAQTGSVAWQFEQKGLVVADVASDDTEEFELVAIDAGAEDFETIDSTLHVYSAPEILEQVRSSLAENGAFIKSSELSMVAKNTVTLDDEKAAATLRLLDQLEELDDIQKVFSNADFPDNALKAYENGR